MGGDSIKKLPPSRYKVSIHAPAWGATPRRHKLTGYLAVSIHAPAWGATINIDIYVCCKGCFNPRPRMGGDINEVGRELSLIGFNPRPRMGGDVIYSIHPQALYTFQSTPPHGGRHIALRYLLSLTGFNPRPRMGGDGTVYAV